MAITVGFIAGGSGEKRVAITPQVIKQYQKLGLALKIDKKAIEGSCLSLKDFDQDTIATTKKSLLDSVDIVVTLDPDCFKTTQSFKSGQLIVSLFDAAAHQSVIKQLTAGNITACGLNWIPRTSRAQMMDVLSSQASTAGYQAALLGATYSPRYFPMLTTAAGTIRPAKVLVVGTGVAGLQAIATAKRLGAIVEAYDIRPETKEQVESLGGRFIDLGIDATSQGGYARELTAKEKQQQLQTLTKHVSDCDVLITTAAVFGRKAPLIITKAMVNQMKKHAVIVDLAAASGGNCELTQLGQVIDHNGIQIIGHVDLPAQVGLDASELLAKNIFNYLQLFVEEGQVLVNMEDDIIQGSVLCHQGQITQPQFNPTLQGESVDA